MFNPNQAFLLVQKLEIGPKAGKKEDTIEFEKPICKQPLGPNVHSIYLGSWDQTTSQKCLKVGLKVSVKVGGPYYTRYLNGSQIMINLQNNTLKQNQNPSRYYDYYNSIITNNLKFQHKPKYIYIMLKKILI
jgi:hypothetical protein